MALNPILRTDAQALMPEEVANSIIEASTRQSAVLQLGRHVMMSRKQMRMPIMAAFPDATWVNPSDTGTKSQSKMSWGNKFITAEELAVICTIPEAVLDDSEFDVWAEVQPRVVEAFGRKLDQATLFGVDRPASFSESVSEGCDRTDNEVKRGTGVDVAEDVNLAMSKVESDGFGVDGHVARIGMKGAFRGLRSSQNVPIFVSSLRSDGGQDFAVYEVPTQFVQNGAWQVGEADVITGDWSNLVIGIRQDITYKVLTEATIGGVNLAETDQVGLRAVFRVGFQILNPPTLENPDDATRYPFAAVRPTGWVGASGSLS